MAAAPVVVVDRREGITPAEQLKRVRAPIAHEVDGAVGGLPGFDQIADIVANYAMSSNLTNWYTALKALDDARPEGTPHILPTRIPPLPRNIHQILADRCPLSGNKRKPDGSFYTVDETHTLMLIPKEFGTVNALEERVRAYGQQHFGVGGANPLQFRNFRQSARDEHGNTEFGATHWVLLSRRTLEDSHNKTFREQAAKIKELNERVFLKYQLPTLQEMAATLFLHKIATGESLYPLDAGNWRNSIYTHLQNMTAGVY